MADRGTTPSVRSLYMQIRRTPLVQEHAERLRDIYPSAPDDLLNSAATRMALISMLSAFVLDDAGPVQGRDGRPEVIAPAVELRRLLSDHERAIERMVRIEAGDGERERADAWG